MNLKIRFVIIFVVLNTLCLCASDAFTKDANDTINVEGRVFFVPQTFTQNLYFDVGLGSSVLFSQDASRLSGSDRFTPEYALGVGKWVSPYCGLYFSFQGYELNGYSTVYGLYTADPHEQLVYGNNDPVRNYAVINPYDGSYRHFIRYIHTSLGFQVSALSLLGGYQDDRQWDVIPSVGLGLFQVIEHQGIPSTSTISFNSAVRCNYHFNEKLDIYVKVSGSLVPDCFEGRISGHTYEGVMNAGFGLSYYFKKKGFKKKIYYDKPQFVAVHDTLYATVEKLDTIYLVKEAPFLEAERIVNDIVFHFEQKTINMVGKKYENQLKSLAQLLKENPELKVQIIGHTCSLGSYETNQRLGMERALVVKQQIVDLGVSEEQLMLVSKSYLEPLVPNTSEANRAINRRVELKVMD